MGEIRKELEQTLAALRPQVSWRKALQAAELDIEEVWRQEQPNSWPMYGPPEDYALPPLMHWSDDLHRLAEAAYHETFGKYLEPGDHFDMEWPPKGSLWSEGEWGYSELPECQEHGEERSAECSECQELTDEIVRVVHAPAVWSWRVTVRHVFADLTEDDDVDDWEMGTTEVAPWTVDYSTFDDGAHGASLVAVVQWVVEKASVDHRSRAISSAADVARAKPVDFRTEKLKSRELGRGTTSSPPSPKERGPIESDIRATEKDIQDRLIADEPPGAKAQRLWGAADHQSRYLVAVVEHGDDMSEEDYSVVGNMLLGAINQAVREYGFDVNVYNREKFYRYVTSQYDDPLVAELSDGTVIVARSATRRGSGSSRTSRRPSPQEHARWAGLPIPPEPPPPPTPEPELIDIVWSRLAENSGTPFKTRRGLEFVYEAYPWNLWVVKPDGSGTDLRRRMIYAALKVWPVSGPTGLPVECGYGQRTYIWGVLADPRIMGITGEGEDAPLS